MTRTRYGEKSEPYANLLANSAIERARAGFIDEARAQLDRSQAIMRGLFADDFRKRMDAANVMATDS